MLKLLATKGRSWVTAYGFLLSIIRGAGRSDIHKFFLKVERMVKTRGTKGTTGYLKDARAVLLHSLLSGTDANRSSSPKGVSKAGNLPAILPPNLRGRIHAGEVDSIRASLTLLAVGRSFFWKKPVDTTTITNGCNSTFKWKDGEVERALAELGFTRGCLQAKPPKLFLSNKKGPNGHAALSAHYDAWALRNSEAWAPFTVLTVMLGEPSLVSKVNRLARLVETAFTKFPRMKREFPGGAPAIGRIAVLREAEGKNRVIAIPDYWTQVILKPIHDALMGALRTIHMDGTYAQGDAFDEVKRATGDGRWIACCDLSSATDRFPIELQVPVLAHLFGDEELALTWRELISERKFWYQGKLLQYATGSPMGALSSWAAFAITHHVFIKVASYRAKDLVLDPILPSGTEERLAQNLGDSPFCGYRVLGDDSAIFDRRVASSYKSMMNLAQVPISVTKSLEGIGVAEFAKRHAWQGQEITGIPGSLVSLMGRKLPGLAVLLRTANERGYSIFAEGVVGALRAWGINPTSRGTRAVLTAVFGPYGPIPVRPTLACLLVLRKLNLASWLYAASLASAPNKVALPVTDFPGGYPSLCDRCTRVEGLAAQIVRHWAIRSLAVSRETAASWAQTLTGSLEMLVMRQIQYQALAYLGILEGSPLDSGTAFGGSESLSSLEKEISKSRDLLKSYPEETAWLNRWVRDLAESHPMTQGAIIPEEEPGGFLKEMDLYDLDRPLVDKAHLPHAQTWGFAPPGDLKLLIGEVRAGRLSVRALLTVESTLGLANSWTEEGSLDMIEEGLLLEIHPQLWKVPEEQSPDRPLSQPPAVLG